jgi:hypothetical protein
MFDYGDLTRPIRVFPCLPKDVKVTKLFKPHPDDVVGECNHCDDPVWIGRVYHEWMAGHPDDPAVVLCFWCSVPLLGLKASCFQE